MRRRMGLAAALLLLAAFTTACEDEAASTPAPTSVVAPTTTSTATPTRTATATATSKATPKSTATASGAPAAPGGVRLSGPLPDPKATVPAGQGELGRVTVSWDPVAGAGGYMIYPKDCNGVVGRGIDLAAGPTSFGPIQPCRPGGDIGVSAISASGAESAITWANP